MKPNMYDNFKLLEERVFDSLEKTDLERISYHLKKINGIIAEHQEPRDMLYKSLKGYDNILACSYGGKNYGVKTSFANNLNKYLFSRNETQQEILINLNYDTSIEAEDSFISLGATLIPMSIMLAYYNDNDISIIKEILQTAREYNIDINKVYEILSGYDTSTASTYLESTLVEAGLASPVVHDKYSLCHGRTTHSYYHDHALIHLDRDTELDRLYKEELPQYYQDVVILEGKYQDQIIDDFYLTYQAMLLSKAIAEKQGKDLSRVDYSPAVKKTYYFKGKM